MPQIYKHSPNETTGLVVWHIFEPETYFRSVVEPGKIIIHPHKRLQHLCGRYLLQYLIPDFPMASVVTEQYNKPFIPGHPYHFSISHCDNYAAAIVSSKQQVGIDIEMIDERVVKIRHKFLTPVEEAMLVNDCSNMSVIQQLSLAWSAKETLFKWLGETGIDFKEHLCLQRVENNFPGGLIVATTKKDDEKNIIIHYLFKENLIITWASSQTY